MATEPKPSMPIRIRAGDDGVIRATITHPETGKTIEIASLSVAVARCDAKRETFKEFRALVENGVRRLLKSVDIEITRIDSWSAEDQN